MIRVEVAYALPDRQRIVALDVEEGCTALAAAQRSGIAAEFPDIDLARAALGIFGRRLENPAATPLQAGDRVEIYRPLLIDPKTVRRQRAAKK
jgi:putative ubiquitin-RnfH superfamily antitoxin RatB of RatAB toxin-antitoxin module